MAHSNVGRREANCSTYTSWLPGIQIAKLTLVLDLAKIVNYKIHKPLLTADFAMHYVHSRDGGMVLMLL